MVMDVAGFLALSYARPVVLTTSEVISPYRRQRFAVRPADMAY
jgi:hypothetical protein